MHSQAPLLVRVDSAEEQYGYMIARFGDPAAWTVDSQELTSLPDGRDCERVVVRLDSGDTVTVGFVPVRDEGLFANSADTAAPARLDELMGTAIDFSRANPPHHPGTVARFPVPSMSYAGAVAVPMAVLAQDQGRRGLYAPPRVVVVDYLTVRVRGVGEFPGFDPESWPPKRVGDWPPEGTAGVSEALVQGMILRFGALWCRVLDAWFESGTPEIGILPDEVEEALELRSRLDVPGMESSYELLNPGFARWLARGGLRKVR